MAHHSKQHRDGGSNRNRDRDNHPSLDLKLFKESWISETFDDKTIDFSEKFGKHLADNRLTTTQIRNVFGEVKRIQGNVNEELSGSNYKDFLLLRPKIAYAAKRAGGRGIMDFKKVMDKAHIAVTSLTLTDEDKASEKTIEQKRADGFQNFTDFFEAVLAYHKAYGGRES